MNEIEVLLVLVRQHAEEDTRRFASMEKTLDAIAADTKSLVESRTLARGAWKATTLIAGLVAGVVSVVGSFLVWFVKS